MRNLITYEEISKLARPCTTDQEMAEAMIAEAQRVDVKPRLGDALYLNLVGKDEFSIIDGGGASDQSFDFVVDSDPETVSTVSSPDKYDMLLNGGQWTDDCGRSRLLTGLKTALAYFALARIVRDGNIQATTYGAVVKDDQYSAEAERTERQRQYRELFSQGDSYMAEVLNYLSHNCKLFPEYTANGKMRSNRTTIKIIGK